MKRQKASIPNRRSLMAKIPCHYLPKRLIVIGLCAFALLISYADRTNLAVGIVYMSKEFNWDSTTEGAVLSAFFFGYFMTQVIGGALADKFGGKIVLGTAAFCWSAFTFLTPPAAKHGLYTLLLCRVLLGVGEGAAFPSIHSIISLWAPISERSRMVGITTSIGYFGSVIALPASTWLGSGPGGWESIFYFFGALGGVWLILWVIFAQSSPAEYQGITIEEYNWINGNSSVQPTRYQQLEENQTGIDIEDVNMDSNDIIVAAGSISGSIKGEDEEESEELVIEETSNTLPSSFKKRQYETKNIPWNRILKHREVWAILIAQFCNSLGYFVILTWLPTFFNDHFNVDVKKLGYFAVLPYIVQGVTGCFVGVIGDFAINKIGLRIITLRRFAQLIGSMGMAVFMLLATFQATTIAQGVFYIACGMGLNTFTLVGVVMSQLDIAPRYAGTIFSLGNTVATIPGFFGVALTGWILDITGHNWGIIWSICALFYVVGGCSFSLWAGGEVVID
ncbi:5083_t:CDS:2 [Ambispora leptoticha]|uniref:5083_t:CDS:1 n=1 Tax=Ambispora leptoticha TaxID=144679 RepID=A0A9N8V8E5_9GLOM|nr:5083_t:CDS:2 [Ambispora leptoticha]